MKSVITNGILSAEIRHRGAELGSLRHEQHQLEYIWQADPTYWAKSSPVLFPVVGQLKGNTYHYDDKSYSLPRHGFARELDFELETLSADRAVFRLTDSNETRSKYPFTFTLRIGYTLKGDSLVVNYSVTNPSKGVLLFSLGAHPAFNVPLVAGTKYDDHYLLFSEEERSVRWNITPEGTIGDPGEQLLAGDKELGLTKALFDHDAVVFKDLKSKCISLRSRTHERGLDFSFLGFPCFGIWAAPGADFVCLEPWAGIADSNDHDQQFAHKEGIIELQPNAEWNAQWAVRCF